MGKKFDRRANMYRILMRLSRAARELRITRVCSLPAALRPSLRPSACCEGRFGLLRRPQRRPQLRPQHRDSELQRREGRSTADACYAIFGRAGASEDGRLCHFSRHAKSACIEKSIRSIFFFFAKFLAHAISIVNSPTYRTHRVCKIIIIPYTVKGD